MAAKSALDDAPPIPKDRAVEARSGTEEALGGASAHVSIAEPVAR